MTALTYFGFLVLLFCTLFLAEVIWGFVVYGRKLLFCTSRIPLMVYLLTIRTYIFYCRSK